MPSKYSFLTGIFIAVLLILLIPTSSNAGMEVSISPPRMEFNLGPGKKKKEVIEVKNQGPTPVELKVYTTGFSISEDGSLNYASRRSYSAENWLRVVPDKLSIRPDDYSVVRYEVQVPEGTRNGSYTASVQIEEVQGEVEGTQRAQVQLKGRLAYIIYVNVGKPVYKGSIESFGASAGPEEIRFRVRLRNSGIYYIRPRGKIVVEKGGKKVREEHYPNLPVFAGQSRTTEVKIPRDLGPGSYKATVTIDIGTGTPLSAVTNFSL